MVNLFKQNKMFRVYLMYQFFSSIGGAMFSMFVLLSVHLIYNNPIYTGIAGFLITLPRIVSFAVGPIVDKRNQVTIMRLTTLLEFSLLAMLAFTPLQLNIGIMFTFAVIFFYNVAALFEEPASTALLPKIVDEDSILTANSLIQIVAMTGGIGIAIILYSSLADDINFSFLYGFSAVFLSLAFLSSLFFKIANKQNAKTEKIDYIADLKEGAAFLKGNVLLLIVIATIALGFFGEITYINRPQFLEYHVGAQGYILFTVMSLVGGIASSYIINKYGNATTVSKFIFVLFILAGAMRIVFTVLVPIRLASALVAMAAYTAMASAAGMVFMTLRQKMPPNNMVGRISTISTTFVAIAVTIGALVGGFLGNVVADTGHIFIFQGSMYFVIALLLMLSPTFRKLPSFGEIKKDDADK